MTELPDGTMNVTVRGLGIKQPPTQDAFALDGVNLWYIARDGLRKLAGTSLSLENGWLDLLFQGYTRYGIPPIDKSTADRSKFDLAVTNGKLFFRVTLVGGGRKIFPPVT